jgi:hypothetical protein
MNLNAVHGTLPTTQKIPLLQATILLFFQILTSLIFLKWNHSPFSAQVPNHYRSWKQSFLNPVDRSVDHALVLYTQRLSLYRPALRVLDLLPDTDSVPLSPLASPKSLRHPTTQAFFTSWEEGRIITNNPNHKNNEDDKKT